MQDQLKAVSLAYEAALEPDKWPEALSAIAKVGDAMGACLVMIDPNNSDHYNFNMCSGNYDLEEFMNFTETHLEFESMVWGKAVAHLKSTDEYAIATDKDLLGLEADLHSFPAYRDFDMRFGALRKLGVMLNQRAPWDDGIGFQFDNKHIEFPTNSLQNISSIAPYLARATSIIRPVQVLEAEHGMMLDVLEKLAIGVGVVTHDGTLVLKNESFERILDLGALYTDPMKRIRAHEATIDGQLRRSMRGTSGMSIGEELDQGEFISVPIKGRNHPVSLEISPLGRRGKYSPRGGWSIIFAIDPHWRLVTDTQKLAQSYSLTIAEKEVCSMLLKGLSNREISDERSCGMETVKSHVSNLLAKTWTANRTELARLAATTEIPLLE